MKPDYEKRLIIQKYLKSAADWENFPDLEPRFGYKLFEINEELFIGVRDLAHNLYDAFYQSNKETAFAELIAQAKQYCQVRKKLKHTKSVDGWEDLQRETLEKGRFHYKKIDLGIEVLVALKDLKTNKRYSWTRPGGASKALKDHTFNVLTDYAAEYARVISQRR